MSQEEMVTDAEIVSEQEAGPQSTAELVNPVRGASESYQDYVIRRRAANRAVKHYIKNGTPFHNSRPEQGKRGVTYVKPKD